MDLFVQNLFDGIEIPDEIPNVEHILTPPAEDKPTTKTPMSADGHTTVLRQVNSVVAPTGHNQSAQCQARAVTTGQARGQPAADMQIRGFSTMTKRPIGDVKAQFIAPRPCQLVPKQESQITKRRCENQAARQSDTNHEQQRAPVQALETAAANADANDASDPAPKKTIAERFPLKGPAGSSVFNLLGGVMMLGDPATDDGTDSRGHSWISAMKMLDANDLGHDFRRYADFPAHFSVSQYVTQKFNIKSIINDALQQQMGFKVDWLAVFTVSQRTLGMQVLCVFMDKSGQMLGYMEEELHSDLKHVAPGCTLILKNVFVYVPVGYMPYLVIRRGDVARVVRNST